MIRSIGTEQGITRSRQMNLMNQIRTCNNKKDLLDMRFAVLKYLIENPADREGYIALNRELAVTERFLRYGNNRNK